MVLNPMRMIRGLEKHLNAILWWLKHEMPLEPLVICVLIDSTDVLKSA